MKDLYGSPLITCKRKAKMIRKRITTCGLCEKEYNAMYMEEGRCEYINICLDCKTEYDKRWKLAKSYDLVRWAANKAREFERDNVRRLETENTQLKEQVRELSAELKDATEAILRLSEALLAKREEETLKGE